MSDLILASAKDLEPKLDGLSVGLSKYLEILGLPIENILVPMEQRGRVIRNLPDVINLLPSDALPNCVYISKFATACTVGLFDAALNYLWDEVILSLRNKVARYDLDYFFNSTISSPDRRRDFRSEDDLIKLDDWELIRGAREIGLLSEVGFKHLDYIRDMRNWASAAHPNQTELTGLQLVSWLETAIKEVIAKEPEPASIVVGSLLHNLREATLSANDAADLEIPIQRLPSQLANSLLRAIFGMYADPRLASSVRDNIRYIAKSVWDISSEDAKDEIGIRYATFSANADVERKRLARQFLTQVQGLGHLTEDTRAAEMSELITNLEAAHYGFNNFHNEPAHARALARYVPETGEIPRAIRGRYVKILTMCRIGNGYGISNAALGYYDRMISRFQEQEIFEAAKLPLDAEFSSRLQFPSCRKNYIELLIALKTRVTNVQLRSAIDVALTTRMSELPSLASNKDFIDLLKTIRL